MIDESDRKEFSLASMDSVTISLDNFFLLSQMLNDIVYSRENEIQVKVDNSVGLGDYKLTLS